MTLWALTSEHSLVVYHWRSFLPKLWPSLQDGDCFADLDSLCAFVLTPLTLSCVFPSSQLSKWTCRKLWPKPLRTARRSASSSATLTTAGCRRRWRSSSSPTPPCHHLASSKAGAEEPGPRAATPWGGPCQRTTVTRPREGPGPSSTTPAKDIAPARIPSRSSLWQTSLRPTRLLGAAPRLYTSTSCKCLSDQPLISGF